jgi:hypothetical protein
MRLNYPVYVIANDEGVLVVNNDGKDCILLFRDRTHAERHIRQAQEIGSKLQVYPLAIPDARALRDGIVSLPPDITCAIWDANLAAGAFVQVAIQEVFQAAVQQ